MNPEDAEIAALNPEPTHQTRCIPEVSRISTVTLFLKEDTEMISTRIFAISFLGAALAATSLTAGDLSKYREFQFGMNLATLTKQAHLAPSDAKTVHSRPAVIQELEWEPRRLANAAPDTDSVDGILFSLYNNELSRMVVSYNRARTEGLTAEDMIDAISAIYGTAAKPDAEIVFPSIYNETVKVIARWEDSEYSLNLVRLARSSYQPKFGMVLSSKRLDTLAQSAAVEAIRMDEQEAPQRAIERQKREEEQNRAEQEKARPANKAGFRP